MDFIKLINYAINAMVTGLVILVHVACGSSIECSCPPGEYVKVPCTAMTSAECEDCRSYTYNDLRDTSTSCNDCLHFCSHTAEVVAHCTPTSNLRCKCKAGYVEYPYPGSMTSCVLGPKVKPTEQVECSCPPGEYVKVPCTAMTSAKCEDCPSDTYNELRDTSTSCKDCLYSCSHKAEVVAHCTPTSNLRCKCKAGYVEYPYPGSVTPCVLAPKVKPTEQVVTHSSKDRNFTIYMNTTEDLKSLHKNGTRCSGSLSVLTLLTCTVLVLFKS